MDDFENISAVSIDGGYLLNKRYKLEKKIGEGSYGVVYKAIDTKNNNNLVAIKQVSKMRINSNIYLIEALQKELSIMRLISDKYSVELIEDFETDEHYNFVMELCDSDLDVQLKNHFKNYKTGFNELQVYYIMTQFNKIFLKLQNEHVIHRDLKLKNIMIKFNKTIPFIGFIIKLSDFGFSKVMNEDDITGTNLGSPATKAPEIMAGKEYNAKADLWSVGVIMYQLFFNRLPFPARNARELKEAIFNATGVTLPKDIHNPMSDICFSLIEKLLQKNPNKRINFDEYFKHKFFSDEHKVELIEKFSKEIEEKNNNKETNSNNENKENCNEKKIDINNKENKGNEDNQKEIKYVKYDVNVNKVDLGKRFIKIIKVKEYGTAYSLYKAKDILYDKYVYIKEINRSAIDNSERNTKIFHKEIELLKKLSGKHKFPDYIDLLITNSHYNIIMEYFSGNNLYHFINKRPLEESLVVLILKQLKTSFEELRKNNIILEFLSPKNFAFTYYQNDTNFEIKFFDYGLNSIFYEEKYIKNYLLEEAELGKVNNFSTNILSFGLTVYKMLFREEALIKKNGDYEVIIKGKIKSEYRENLKYFLSKCIKKEKRYNNWEELFLDNFLNFNLVDQKHYNILDKRQPLIEDEKIEKILEIVIKKLNYILNYFDKLFDDKDQFLDNELYTNYYDEIITFLLFCTLECKTVLKFLKNNVDDRTQEIHLFKIYINKNNKEDNNYDYSYINFINENKNNNLFLYNKENPTFEVYISKFSNIEKEINIIYNKFIGNINSLNNLERSNSSSDGFVSACSSILNNTQEKEKEKEKIFTDNIDLKSEKDVKITQEGNLDKLFMKIFENGTMFYSFEEKEKAIEELYIAKYIVEYIIFLRVILGNKDSTLKFDKLILVNDENNNNAISNNDSYKNENVIFATFIGGNIKLFKEKGIWGYNYNGSNDNLTEYNNPKIENIKIYDTMINFYPKIIQFISEIKKEQK